jgi:hypothetical protein
MRKFLFPIALCLTTSLIAAPASAQDLDIDPTVLACQVEPESCLAAIEQLLVGVDAANENVGIALGLLAARLFDIGLALPADGRAGIFAALERIAATMSEIAPEQAAAILDLMEELDADTDDDGPIDASSS